MAALLASFLPDKEVRSAVIHAPMLHPRIIYRQIKRFWLNIPLLASTTIMLTVTEEDWIIAVTSQPIKSARIGFDSEANICWTAALSLRGFTASPIMEIPRNKTPKPTIISPKRLIFVFLINIYIMTPTARKIGANCSRLNDTSCEVMVVPMLAPMITPTA